MEGLHRDSMGCIIQAVLSITDAAIPEKFRLFFDGYVIDLREGGVTWEQALECVRTNIAFCFSRMSVPVRQAWILYAGIPQDTIVREWRGQKDPELEPPEDERHIF